MLRARKEGKADIGDGTDWTNVFPTFAVDAESYFPMAPELRVEPDQFRAFLRERQGCLIGRELAEKFGWKIDDRFFLESVVPALRKPDGPFEFVIRGLIDADRGRFPSTDPNSMFFHYAYLNESLGGQLWTGYYTVEVTDPRRVSEIAKAIDALFENSAHQTLTETESAFAAGLMSIAGDLSVLVGGIGLATIFTILVVTANTMSMAVRERRTEIAVLKTLGFTGAGVMALIMAEGALLGGLGGAVGIAGAVTALSAFNHARGATLLGLSAVELRPSVALIGMAAALLIGLSAGLMPAWSAYRARITEMLRSV
jgi:putative ABC transport system permease protein